MVVHILTNYKLPIIMKSCHDVVVRMLDWGLEDLGSNPHCLGACWVTWGQSLSHPYVAPLMVVREGQGDFIYVTVSSLEKGQSNKYTRRYTGKQRLFK